MARRCVAGVLGLLSGVVLLSAAPDDPEVERLVRLARVWAAVKFLHPVLLQREIDWDGALVRALPGVRSAATAEDFARAVGSMLAELNDPVTRVVQPKAPSPSQTTLVRTVGDVLVIAAGPYADGQGLMELWQERSVLEREIAKARRVIVDVRHHPADPDEVGAVAFVISELTGLTDAPIAAPSSLSVHHSGYTPQEGGSSGGYFSGLLITPGQSFAPAPGTAAPSSVIFVTDGDSRLPAIAAALRDAGKAAIVSDVPLDDAGLAATTPIDLGAGRRALIRVEQLASNDFAADVVAADPLAEALAILEGRRPHPPRRTAPENRAPGDARWRPDPAYADMHYPDAAHRLLAAFRIWSVIHYFYPYKALIGDWDAAFAEAIPRFIAAADEDEYATAVLRLVARVEDGHSRAFGHPALARILGAARPPIEVREVERELVVTRPLAGLPAEAGVRAGDIVLSVDGMSIRKRMEELRPLVTASTPDALTNALALVALQGAAGSTAELTVRDAEDRVRTIHLPRLERPLPVPAGEPYRLLDGNVGYVDLSRLTVAQVDGMFDALMGARGIVFDMRGYPRGTAWSIAPRLNVKGAKVGAVFRRAQVSGVSPDPSAAFYFEQPLPVSTLPKYAGKTVMLIDDRAISQSEHTGLFFEAACDITFIGTPTAGANGDVTRFLLPGGFRVMFTGHDVRHADGRQLQRVGLQPHIRVTPTIAGLRAGRDEVLERALSFLAQR